MASRIDLWAHSPIRSHYNRIARIKAVSNVYRALPYNSGVRVSHPRDVSWLASLRGVLDHILPDVRLAWLDEAPDPAERMRLPARLQHESKPNYPFNGPF